LNSFDEAKRRVSIRVQNGWHFVHETEIQKRYYEGFTNLNSNFSFFDCIDIFVTSAYGAEPRYILSIENGEIKPNNILPDFIKILLPELVNRIY